MKNLKEVKCVVWDLDNTLWDGILTESNSIQIKPDIVKIINELDKRGILQSIASKNNFEDAMNQLKKLKIDHYFLYPQINWDAKSKSIASIQKNLNIGIDTFMFIDDQPFERDEVKSVHPEVECLDASIYSELLEHKRCNPRFITSDSELRRQKYQEDIKRKDAEENFTGTPTDFLATLEMEFIISEAKEEDLKRAEELTVRTHQLNTTGVTYNYDELNDFRHSSSHKLLVCELKDRYGNYGKIGLALIELNNDHWYLKLLLMSCRVMSRGVGTVLLNYIMKEAKKVNKKLLADFKVTDRNRQMYITYRFNNFQEIEKKENDFVLLENDLTFVQEYPDYIKLQLPGEIPVYL